MGAGGRDEIREAGPLPWGIVLAGALKGLFKRQEARVLPQTRWARTVELDPQDYGAYAALCGFSPDQGVPLTWPYVLSFPLQMRLVMASDFPYRALGLVHLGNQIRQESRLYPGDRLRLTCQSDQLHAHPKGQAFALKTTAERDGAVIWSTVSLYLRRGIEGVGLELERDLVDLPLGKPDHKIASFTADLETARLYAGLSGDANPIHTSAIMSRILGFSGPIAHGMWTKARAISALTEGRSVDVAEAEVSFRNPLLLPAKAELYAASSGTGCDFECRNNDQARTYLRGRLSLL